MPWWDIFEPGELRIIAVRSGDRLVGFAPLYRDGSRLLPIGMSSSDYHDVLLHPEHAQAAADEIASAVNDMDDIDACEFDDVLPEACVLRICPESWQERLATASPRPVLRLPGSIPELASCIPPARLRHLRTARGRVARRGDSAILVSDIDNAVSLFRELVRLRNPRGQFQDRSGVLADPRAEAFHATALPRLVEQGLARLYALTIGDVVAGVYYGFRHRDTAYAYICAVDPDFAFEGPGSVLLGHAIEEAVREGASAIDFLRGSDDDKSEWGAQDRWNVRVAFRRRGQIGN